MKRLNIIEKNKKGALEISFGMIFSIILIIVFLAFAFFGIKRLIGVQETSLVGQFKYDLQNDIDTMWNGPQGNQKMIYQLPKKIEGVCFIDDNSENLYFLPIGKYSGGRINHIDISGTLGSRDEKCFMVQNGKIEITLIKDFGKTEVTLK